MLPKSENTVQGSNLQLRYNPQQITTYLVVERLSLGESTLMSREFFAMSPWGHDWESSTKINLGTS